MFDFFRKKKRTLIDNLFNSLDEQSVTALGTVAKVLGIQLFFGRSRPSYNAELQSKFVRGYLFGFFDAALQRLGLPHRSDEDAIVRIIAGHAFVFYDQNIDVIQYVKDSIGLQDDPIYKAAHQKGVDELFKCFGTDERKPYGLVQYFMEQHSSEGNFNGQEILENMTPIEKLEQAVASLGPRGAYTIMDAVMLNVSLGCFRNVGISAVAINVEDVSNPLAVEFEGDKRSGSVAQFLPCVRDGKIYFYFELFQMFAVIVKTTQKRRESYTPLFLTPISTVLIGPNVDDYDSALEWVELRYRRAEEVLPALLSGKDPVS